MGLAVFIYENLVVARYDQVMTDLQRIFYHECGFDTSGAL